MRILCLILIVLFLQPLPLSAFMLAGTGDSEALLQRLTTEFTRLHPETVIDVPPSVGSSGGIRMLLQGRTELARVARPLRAVEARQGLNWRQFAVVPTVFVANLPRGCVSELSSQQIVEIFAGRINRWSQLGNCPDQKIYLARREEGDSSKRILDENITGLSGVSNPVGKILYTTPEAYETVVSHPYTLGYLPQTQILGTILTSFALDGVVANAETIADGRYPLQLTLAVVWKEPLHEESREFLDFLASPLAQQLIRSFGAIPASAKEF